MNNNSLLLDIKKNVSYTDLVFNRINKKLNSNLSIQQIIELINNILTDTKSNITRKGKNYYITNTIKKIRITINFNTYRVITADITN